MSEVMQTILGHSSMAMTADQKQQITGIEPASPAWEAGVLPMNHICISKIIALVR